MLPVVGSAPQGNKLSFDLATAFGASKKEERRALRDSVVSTEKKANKADRKRSVCKFSYII
jgi:hypothetical protein